VLEELGYALGVVGVRLRGVLAIRARDCHSSHPNNEAHDCDTKVHELIYLHVRAPYFEPGPVLWWGSRGTKSIVSKTQRGRWRLVLGGGVKVRLAAKNSLRGERPPFEARRHRR